MCGVRGRPGSPGRSRNPRRQRLPATRDWQRTPLSANRRARPQPARPDRSSDADTVRAIPGSLQLQILRHAAIGETCPRLEGRLAPGINGRGSAQSAPPLLAQRTCEVRSSHRQRSRKSPVRKARGVSFHDRGNNKCFLLTDSQLHLTQPHAATGTPICSPGEIGYTPGVRGGRSRQGTTSNHQEGEPTT